VSNIGSIHVQYANTAPSASLRSATPRICSVGVRHVRCYSDRYQNAATAFRYNDIQIEYLYVTKKGRLAEEDFEPC
jgi:hypothetical protein